MNSNLPNAAAAKLAGEAAARAASLDPETVAACQRAARALSAHLAASGEQPLSHAQINLIRALHLAAVSAPQPATDARRVLGMVAAFFTPLQLDFAVELLAEALEGQDDEAWAIADELERIAVEARSAGGRG